MKRILTITLLFFSLFIIDCDKQKPEQEPSVQEDTSRKLPSEYSVLLGKEFGPDSFPTEFEEHTGYVMGFMEGDEYIIDHVSRGEAQLLWFCKLTHRDSEGRPYLKILDVLILPPIPQDAELIMGNCKYQGNPDPEIISLVRFLTETMSTQIIQCWRADRSTNRFAEIPEQEVSCEDESYYL